MKKYIQRIKQNKTLTILLIILIISLVLGIFYITRLTNSNKNLISKDITNYLNSVEKQNINTTPIYIKTIASNTTTNIIIWLLGISLIGIPITLILFIFKSFSTTFTFTSLIYNYGFKGILLAIIYIIPHIINLFIIFILTYYSLSFSIMLFNYLFRKKEYNRRLIVKRYFKILLISLVITILTTSIEIYLIPYIIKYLYF